MIYISAQPDDLYFLWQIEVQLYNFNRLGIPKEAIHVLIAYNPLSGLREEFKTLIKTNKNACFFTYPDDRIKKTYLSSIRPNILKKHFKLHDYLENETIFYHDSDIIFRAPLDINVLTTSNTWYVSDTRNYIAPSYIKRFGIDIFQKMCTIVGIDPLLVENNESNSGGAQYVLKNVNHQFWDHVETDSEKIFVCLFEFNQELLKKDKNAKSIQAWCADMWALLWNGLKFGHQIEIHPELDFSWPMQDLGYWDKCKIFHNAGVKRNQEKNYFFKSLYSTHKPYHENFSFVPENKCSVKYVEEITSYADTLQRYDLNDVTFIIPIRMDSEDRLQNLDLITRFLRKHFNTHILVVEKDDIPRINPRTLPKGVNYTFTEDRTRNFHRTRILNQAIINCETPIISIYDSDVIVNPENIIEAVSAIRNQLATLSYPYEGTFVNVDRFVIRNFSAELNFDLLSQFFDHNARHIKHSYGGCCFVNKEHYITCGLENEFFSSWGRDDIERAKRVQILGYKLYRTRGVLIHLNHYRGESSKPQHSITSTEFDKEYLKICGMKKPDLQNYVKSWPWINANL